MQTEIGDYHKYCEECLMSCCAPTIKGVKCANLFTISFENIANLREEVQRLNYECREKGLECTILRIYDHKGLVYVYRRKLLEEILSDARMWNLLAEAGYTDDSVDGAIQTLMHRICEEKDFPHEIGVFLNYPYEDIVGFMEKGSREYLLCGYWKVYDNPARAKQTFDLYDACRKWCMSVFYRGATVAQVVAEVSS